MTIFGAVRPTATTLGYADADQLRIIQEKQPLISKNDFFIYLSFRLDLALRGGCLISTEGLHWSREPREGSNHILKGIGLTGGAGAVRMKKSFSSKLHN